MQEITGDPDNPRRAKRISLQWAREMVASYGRDSDIVKVKVLGEEWLPDSDLLTPTSKLKRRGIHAAYAEQIESLYA